MKNRFEQLDSNEFRTGMLFLWLAGICLVGAAIGLKYPDFGFAVFTLLFVAALAFLTGLYWMSIPFRAYEQEVTDDEAEPQEGGDAPQDLPQLPATEPQPLPQSAIQERGNFYIFLYGVCRQGIIGETEWEKRDLPRSTYRKWITLLEQDGIVTPGARGQNRIARVSFEEALQIIENNSGELDYWKEAKKIYHPANTGNSLLIFNQRAM